MLTSPISITVNTVATDVHRIKDLDLSSDYASTDGTLEFKVSHQFNKSRARRMARLDSTKIAADPLTAVNAYKKAGVYIVIDEPDFGFDNDEIVDVVEALKGWLTEANVLAMLASRH